MAKQRPAEPRPDAAGPGEEILYGAQTRLAVANFGISGLRFPRAMIRALGLTKACAARANSELAQLSTNTARAIEEAALAVAEGLFDDQFPVDVLQTGSGTSTNMNANEVIAELAARRLGRPIHANDDVNRGQSSNDVIPTAIHVSAALELERHRAALASLHGAILARAGEYAAVVKTGRTHLMDAVPMTLGQELAGWAAQVQSDLDRLQDVGQRLLALAQGGTAVGTGLSAHPELASRFAALMAERTGLAFRPAANTFAAIGAQDTAVELSGQLRVVAITLLKIATDLLTQLSLLTGAARSLEGQAITRLEANVGALAERAGRNAMLVTALTPRIGYDLAGRTARTALEQGRSVIDVERELSGVPEAELVDLLDPMRMARPHDQPGGAS